MIRSAPALDPIRRTKSADDAIVPCGRLYDRRQSGRLTLVRKNRHYRLQTKCRKVMSSRLSPLKGRDVMLTAVWVSRSFVFRYEMSYLATCLSSSFKTTYRLEIGRFLSRVELVFLSCEELYSATNILFNHLAAERFQTYRPTFFGLLIPSKNIVNILLPPSYKFLCKKWPWIVTKPSMLNCLASK